MPDDLSALTLIGMFSIQTTAYTPCVDSGAKHQQQLASHAALDSDLPRHGDSATEDEYHAQSGYFMSDSGSESEEEKEEEAGCQLDRLESQSTLPVSCLNRKVGVHTWSEIAFFKHCCRACVALRARNCCVFYMLPSGTTNVLLYLDNFDTSAVVRDLCQNAHWHKRALLHWRLTCAECFAVRNLQQCILIWDATATWRPVPCR